MTLPVCECHVRETVPVERAAQLSVAIWLSVALCPRHAEAHVAELEVDLAQCQADRNRLASETEALGASLLKATNQWPVSEGSPMGRARAQIARLEAEVGQLREAAKKALAWILLGNHEETDGWVEARDALDVALTPRP